MWTTIFAAPLGDGVTDAMVGANVVDSCRQDWRFGDHIARAGDGDRSGTQSSHPAVIRPRISNVLTTPT